jgi:hypothetical protein
LDDTRVLESADAGRIVAEQLAQDFVGVVFSEFSIRLRFAT